MSVAVLCVFLAGASGLLAVVLNHVYARIALVELTLNEGLPPGHEIITAADTTLAPGTVVAGVLDHGVHLFASRNCHACQRLLDELAAVSLQLEAGLYVHYVDRPRPLARQVADRHGAVLYDHHGDLAQQVAADPLPYTIAVGSDGLLSRGVTPSIGDVLTTARNAGLPMIAEVRA